MHMRRRSKAICAALSMMLTVNLVGLEVTAAGVDQADQQVTGQTGSEDTGSGDKDNITGGGTSDTTGGSVAAPTPETGNGQDDGSGDIQGGGSSNDSTGMPTDNTGSGDNQTGATTDSTTNPTNPTTPEQPDAGAANPDEVGPQAIEGLTVKPVAGSKDELEISWTVRPEATYTLKVTDEEGKDVFNQSELTSGKEKVRVAAGKKYDVTVTDNAGENPNTLTVPAIFLTAPAVKATQDGDSVKLTWGAVAGAESYDVTCGSKTEKVAGTSYTLDDASGAAKISVVAVRIFKDAQGNDIVYKSAAGEAVLVEKPGKVEDLTGIDGEKSAILTWEKVKGATSYLVYRYNSSDKKWEVLKKGLTKLTYTDKKLSEGKKYKYRVAAENKGGIGDYSDTLTISVKKTPSEDKPRSIGYKATVKSRAPLFATKKGTKRVKYLNKGTSVTTIDYGNGRYQIKLSNGKTYWLSKDRLTFRASIWTTKDYSTKAKEDFVNKKGYKSPSKYLIWISQYTQRVIIYQGSKGKWKMIRNCRCATGTHLHMTPKGVHKITYKEKGWFYKTTYEKPIVHFQSQNSFHSRIKNYKGGYADATIGRPRSKGCVRLYDEDINFIYKKCPKGTTVVSY